MYYSTCCHLLKYIITILCLVANCFILVPFCLIRQIYCSDPFCNNKNNCNNNNIRTIPSAACQTLCTVKLLRLQFILHLTFISCCVILGVDVYILL